MQAPIILLADDHAIIRRGIKFLIDAHFGKFEVIETETAKSILSLTKEHKPTHLILDMQLQDGNVMEIFQELRKQYPDVLILIYTMSPEEIFGKRMIQLGANSFLSKQSSEQELVHTLDLFFRGKKYISQNLSDLLVNEQLKKANPENPIKQLSDRETQVLSYLLKGDGLKEIALKLNVKPNTIATFKARLFDKLGVSNIIDLRNVADIYEFHSS